MRSQRLRSDTTEWLSTVFRGPQRRAGSGLISLDIKGLPWVGTFSSRKGNLSPARKVFKMPEHHLYIYIYIYIYIIKYINNPHILMASLMPVRKQGSCGSVIAFRVTAVSFSPSLLAFPSLKPPGRPPTYFPSPHQVLWRLMRIAKGSREFSSFAKLAQVHYMEEWRGVWGVRLSLQLVHFTAPFPSATTCKRSHLWSPVDWTNCILGSASQVAQC